MRLDCAFCAFCAFCVLSAGAGLAAAAVVVPGPADGEALGAGWLFAAGLFVVVPDRKNARAGDDGDWGGGSGISQANAAGERDGGSAAGAGSAGGFAADGGGPKLKMGESSASAGAAALLFVVPRSGPTDPMVSAGSAGTPSTRVASAAAGLPLAEAPLDEVSSVPFPLAGAPFA